ncbi:MAG: DUF364 domain-containing protein [Bacillota bacterium]
MEQQWGILDHTISDIRRRLGARLEEITVERTVFGLFFTGVKLCTGHGGLSFTPVKEMPEAVCCPSSAKAMPLSGKLSGRTAAECLNDAFSTSVLKKAMGIAAINALSALIMEEDASLSQKIITKYNVDAFDLISPLPGQKTVVVGALVPILKRLIREGHDFTVLEMDSRTLKGEELKRYRPADEAEAVVPFADILVITGTTLLNDTLDGLLRMRKPGAQVLVTGPTASMLPDAFFDNGVTMLGGIQITNSDDALAIISEAGSGYHLFGRCAERTVMLRR